MPMIKTLLNNLAKHPVLNTACKQVTTEITSLGLVGAVDKILDHIAYKIAVHIVDEEERISRIRSE